MIYVDSYGTATCAAYTVFTKIFNVRDDWGR